MTINLTKILKLKQAESKLSNEALAKAIGVSTVSVTGVIKGKSKPNATTAKKYAAFLGIDVAELTKVKAGKVAKRGPKAAKATKAKASTSPKAAKPAKVRKSAGLGADLLNVVAVAAAVLDDELALAVHSAGKAQRDLIGRLLQIV